MERRFGLIRPASGIRPYGSLVPNRSSSKVGNSGDARPSQHYGLSSLHGAVADSRVRLYSSYGSVSDPSMISPCAAPDRTMPAPTASDPVGSNYAATHEIMSQQIPVSRWPTNGFPGEQNEYDRAYLEKAAQQQPLVATRGGSQHAAPAEASIPHPSSINPQDQVMMKEVHPMLHRVQRHAGHLPESIYGQPPTQASAPTLQIHTDRPVHTKVIGHDGRMRPSIYDGSPKAEMQKTRSEMGGHLDPTSSGEDRDDGSLGELPSGPRHIFKPNPQR